MTNDTIALISVAILILLVYGGMHVAFALGAVSFIGVWLIRDDITIASNMLAQACTDAIASHVFGVVPLFVLTGFIVAHSDIGKDAFEIANQLFRRVVGGLGIATVFANAIFAAITHTRDAMQRAKQTYEKQGRRGALEQYQAGDKVLLSTSTLNLRVRGKLTSKFVGPFEVLPPPAIHGPCVVLGT